MKDAPGLIIDSFAGGGGASTGIELALGRSPDIAINHDAEALAMHAANHPNTRHLSKNIWQVDPLAEVGHRKVDLAWFSPDCKHFSKAKGGKPVKASIRDLAWVVVRWAKQTRPRIIMLENVEEFRGWGPLKQAIDADGKLRFNDDKTPMMLPDPERKGETFKKWMNDLKRLGYRAEFRELRACDYGAPTIRKRFFMIARRDGRKIVWPEPTHGDPKSEAVKSGRLLPWVPAAEIIDWTLPCPSIFLTREEGRAIGCKRPLEDATMRRIFKGVDRYVITAAHPFIVNLTHQGGDRTEPVTEPMMTVTGAHRGEKAVVVPHIEYAQQGGGLRDIADPLHTVTASHKDQNQLIAPVIVRTAHGERDKTGKKRGKGEHDAAEPLNTVLGSPEFGIVAPHLMTMRNAQKPHTAANEPSHTITAGGAHINLVSATIVGCGGRAAESRPRGADEPTATQTAKADSCVAAVYMAQHNNDGDTPNPGRKVSDPISTITSSGSHQNLVAAHLTKFRANSIGSGMDEPAPTVTANSFHKRPGGAPPMGVVAAHLSHLYGSNKEASGGDVTEPMKTVTSQGQHAAAVYAFMMKYYGTGEGQAVDEPTHTVTTKDRFGVITVTINGEPYFIADIGMRMLTPRELFGAQGFPASYIIERGMFALPDGSHEFRKLTKTAQIRMCGNSVSPMVAKALVAANFHVAEPHVRERVSQPGEMSLWPEDRAA